MIELEDGTVIDADGWEGIMRAIARRAKSGKKVSKIVSDDNVTIKVGNLDAKDDMRPTQPHENYIESTYRGWKIRVWSEEGMYCCNYFKGENIQYLEVPRDAVSDENVVFKLAEERIG